MNLVKIVIREFGVSLSSLIHTILDFKENVA